MRCMHVKYICICIYIHIYHEQKQLICHNACIAYVSCANLLRDVKPFFLHKLSSMPTSKLNSLVQANGGLQHSLQVRSSRNRSIYVCHSTAHRACTTTAKCRYICMLVARVSVSFSFKRARKDFTRFLT